MKFALCDDNPNELRQIRDYLLRYNAQANWKGFASSEELLAAFRRDYFDIVLLDIEMEGMNGYQAAEELNKLPDIPLIIFITQSGAYIIRGYEVAFRELEHLPPITVYEPTYVERPPEVDMSEPLEITHEDDTWLVEGPWLQRLMANVNFGDYESRNWFDRMLRQSGLFDRLEEMGIQDGDIVSLYNLEFEYQR